MTKPEKRLRLKPAYIDCSIAMMLKALDEKCAMSDDEKHLAEEIYDKLKGQRGQVLNHKQRDLIILGCMARCKGGMCAEMSSLIHEERINAEELIAEPVMDAFKAILRNKGYFASNATMSHH